MNNNKMFIDIGRFIAKQIDDIKNYVEKVSGDTKDRISSFDGVIGEMAQKQSVFYTDFTAKLKKSQEDFEEKSKVVDGIVEDVAEQTQIIKDEIADNDISFGVMNTRISTTETNIASNDTEITNLNSTVLDVANETAANLTKLELKLLRDIEDEVTALDTKIADTKQRLDTILSLSEDDKNTFVEIVAYIKSVDTNNDNALYNYIQSNNTRVGAAETETGRVKTSVTNLTSTVNSNKVAANVEFSSVKSLLNTEKARIDSILSASTVDKDTFKEVVDFINSIDLENDANLATFQANVNTSLASYLTMINNRYSKTQVDDGFLGKTATSVSTTKLATSRKISIAGNGITGYVMFDGTQDATINLSFDGAKHNHDTQYLAKTAKATDSDKLDGLTSSQFLRADQSSQIEGDLTVNSNSSKINFSSANSSSENMTIGTNSKGFEIFKTSTPNTKILKVETTGVESTVPYRLNGQDLDDRYLGKGAQASNSDKLDGYNSTDFVRTNSQQALDATNPITVSDDTITLHRADGSSKSVSISDASLTTENVQDIIGGMLPTSFEGVVTTYDDTNGKLNISVNDPVITLTGDIVGTAQMTNLGNVSIDTTLNTTLELDAHTHSINQVTNLQSELDSKSDTHSHPYLGSSSKAVDSDKLDGLDSSAFAKATELASLESELASLESELDNKLSVTNNVVTNSLEIAQPTAGKSSLVVSHKSNDPENTPAIIIVTDGEASDIIADFRANPDGTVVDTSHTDSSPDSKVKIMANGEIYSNGNKVLHEGNTGSGSGLDADKLDGMHASDFIPAAGGTVTGELKLQSANPTISFNGTSDSGVDMAIRATPEGLDFIEPEQSDRIQFQIFDDGGVNSPYGYKWAGKSLDERYLRQNSSPTFDNGTNTTITIKSDDNGVSRLSAIGNSQGTGVVEVGQSATYGGGMFYNGDSSPGFATGEASDYISFFRHGYGVNEVVFDYSVGNNVVRFRDTPTIKTGSTYNKVLDTGSLPAQMKTINGESLVGDGDIKIDLSSKETYASVKTMGIYVHGSSSSYRYYSQEKLNSSAHTNHPLMWLFTAGNTTDHTYTFNDITSPKLELVEKGKFDIRASHYDLSDSRVNTDILFYDVNENYLGKFHYRKPHSCWNRRDHGITQFYNASGGLIANLTTDNWSGTSYGQGALFASIDLSVSNVLKFHPHTTTSNAHYFSQTRTFYANHPFHNAKFIAIQPKEIRAGYYRSSPHFLVSNIFGGIWSKNR